MSLLSSAASVEELYETYEALKKEDVAKLMKWQEMQPHLPPPDELESMAFLHTCNYSSETAKKRIDSFFTFKTLVPEFFSNLDPCRQEMAQVCKTMNFILLPYKTKENELILYMRLKDTKPAVFNFNETVKFFCMSVNIWLRQLGCQNGMILCVDTHGCSFGHLAKVSLISLKKIMCLVQESLPIKLRAIYYVNPNSTMDKLLSFINPFIGKNLMLKVLPGDSLFEYIPKDHLPQEAGGKLDTVATLAGNQLEFLQYHMTFFLHDESRKSDESKRPGKPKNEGDLFGLEGTFKKLDID